MSKKYEVKATDYGLELSVLGFISPAEVGAMNLDIERLGKKQPDGFGVIVDMRANRAFSNEVAELMKEQIGLCVKTGMNRAAVVLQSAIMTLQARRLVTETGMEQTIRFIDASSDGEWMATARDWVERGTEPPARATGGA